MKKITSLIAIAVLTAIDQIIKFFVERDLRPIREMSFIDGFIGWHYVRNTGAAFGSFSNSTVLLSVFTAVLLSGGIAALLMGKIKDKFYSVCAVIVIAGGLGNLIDRIFRGFVVDYIEVQFMDFAVFNFADILVTCGAFMIMGYTVYDLIRERKLKKAGDDNG
ncbi:MAG: signal peptidase II [Acutalibacteraceae bacterium]|nr:signal peptidase II [Acutalibacteraceae bacterium]